MHKSERLFQLVNMLRGRRTAITAAQLAEQLRVSERTIYRDIQTLTLQGVNIEGEAGVGFMLQGQTDLPPLSFSESELESLLLGARMAQAWSDTSMAVAANSAISKILAAMPDRLKATDEDFTLKVPRFRQNDIFTQFSEELRRAIKRHTVVDMQYSDIKQRQTQRRIEPLGLIFWGATWTLVSFCQLRQAYRCFRLDRIYEIKMLEESFELLPNKNLQHCIKLMEAEACKSTHQATETSYTQR